MINHVDYDWLFFIMFNDSDWSFLTGGFNPTIPTAWESENHNPVDHSWSCSMTINYCWFLTDWWLIIVGCHCWWHLGMMLVLLVAAVLAECTSWFTSLTNAIGEFASMDPGINQGPLYLMVLVAHLQKSMRDIKKTITHYYLTFNEPCIK